MPRHPRLGGCAHRVPHGEKLRGRCRVRPGPGGGRLPAQALRRGRAAREGGGAPAAGAARAQARRRSARCGSTCVARRVWASRRATKTEFDVCEFLARHLGQVFSRDQIVENVLGWDAESAASTISVHVANARETEGGGPIGHTVWGVGYKWTA
ncbi:MAG: winged helix-turn-helix domain-containing protein [Eggerthella lenta]